MRIGVGERGEHRSRSLGRIATHDVAMVRRPYRSLAESRFHEGARADVRRLRRATRPVTPAAGTVLGRYYDPNTDQFLSIDPHVGLTRQAYGLAIDDPLDHQDRAGLHAHGCDGVGGQCTYQDVSGTSSVPSSPNGSSGDVGSVPASASGGSPRKTGGSSKDANCSLTVGEPYRVGVAPGTPGETYADSSAVDIILVCNEPAASLTISPKITGETYMGAERLYTRTQSGPTTTCAFTNYCEISAAYTRSGPYCHALYSFCDWGSAFANVDGTISEASGKQGVGSSLNPPESGCPPLAPDFMGGSASVMSAACTNRWPRLHRLRSFDAETS